MDFYSSWTLWTSGWLSIQHKNIDLSAILNAVDLSPIGEPAEIGDDDFHYTAATSIQKDYGETPPPSVIKVALLDDDESSGHGSPDGYAAWTGTYPGDPNEEISALRVSAIHSYSIAARVGVAYMSKEDGGSDWDIKAFTLEWGSENNFPNYSPTQSAVTTISEDEDNETDDYSPDIAFDPLTGLMHIVWTGNSDEAYHPYRVLYSTWDGVNDPSTPVGIYEDGTGETEVEFAGWAPRIAIGSAGINGCDDIVGIVYSAYSSVDEPDYVWHPAAAYWDVDTEGPADARFMHLVYMDDTDDAAGYPRIALAPRLSNDYCGSIVFTQYDDSAGIFQTIEINNVRNNYWVAEGYRETADEEFSAAVSIHYDEVYPTASISHFEQNSLLSLIHI